MAVGAELTTVAVLPRRRASSSNPAMTFPALTVREAVESDRGRWNDFVEAAATPALNRFEWRAILHDVYGPACRFFLAEDTGDTLRGIAAGYVNPAHGSSATYYGLRFGLVVGDARAEGALIERVRSSCHDHGVAPGFICSGYQPLATPDSDTSDERCTALLDINGSAEHVWKRLRDKTRNTIRKGTRAGLVAEWGGHNLSAFYELYASTFTEKGRAVHSWRFFQRLFAELPGNSALLAAKVDGIMVGATVVLFSGSVLHYPFQVASNTANRSLAPSSFMVWELVQEAVRRGISRIDMGESQPGSGAYRFKLHFGGRPAPIHYYRLTPGRHGESRRGGSRALRAVVLSAIPAQSRRRLAALRAASVGALPLKARRRLAVARAGRGRIL